MTLRPFALEQPTTVAEGCALLGRYGEAAKAYAAGTALLVVVMQGPGRQAPWDQATVKTSSPAEPPTR